MGTITDAEECFKALASWIKDCPSDLWIFVRVPNATMEDMIVLDHPWQDSPESLILTIRDILTDKEFDFSNITLSYNVDHKVSLMWAILEDGVTKWKLCPLDDQIIHINYKGGK